MGLILMIACRGSELIDVSEGRLIQFRAQSDGVTDVEWPDKASKKCDRHVHCVRPDTRQGVAQR